MPQLTSDEIKILLEALDEWVKSVSRNDLMGTMLTTMLLAPMLKDDPEAKAEHQAKIEQDTIETKAKTRTREEQSVMLKAKLISMRDKVEAQEFATSTLGAD